MSSITRLTSTCFLGCPSSCKCEDLYEGPEKTILVKGEDLVTVPSKLPSKTGVVYVIFSYEYQCLYRAAMWYSKCICFCYDSSMIAKISPM